MLIHAAPKLVLPYTAPVLKALITKLRAAGGGAAAAVNGPSTAIVPAVGGGKGNCERGGLFWSWDSRC